MRVSPLVDNNDQRAISLHTSIILFQTIFDSAILIPPMQESTCGSMEEGSK
jgi:hypothetical protein